MTQVSQCQSTESRCNRTIWMSLCTVAALLTTLGFGQKAKAHISMNVADGASHDARWNNVYTSKAGPCGEAGGAARSPYTYVGGETITVTVVEVIPHPGYFRIAFDPDGDDGFMDPRWIVANPATREGGCPRNSNDQCKPDGDGDFFNNDTVLMDDLDHHDSSSSGTKYTWQVTLPDVACDNCTLQIIQVMEDPALGAHGDYNTTPGDDNDVYHQCVDLILTASGNPDPGTMDGSVDMETGGMPATNTGGMPVGAGGLLDGATGGVAVTGTGGVTTGTGGSDVAMGTGGVGSGGVGTGGVVVDGTGAGDLASTGGAIAPAVTPTSDSGCACTVAGATRERSQTRPLLLLALGLSTLWLRRRRARTGSAS